MTEREMLELAAKAMGIDDAQFVSDTTLGIRYGFEEAIWSEKLGEYWNPIASSSDCADMEAELELNLTWVKDKGVLSDGWCGYSGYEKFSDHNGDKKKARRYASTHAAAAIGKAMP